MKIVISAGNRTLWVLAIFSMLFLSTVGRADTDRQALKELLAGCRSETSYDPEKLEGVGEKQLAPNERKYLNCAYDTIEKQLIPQATYPEEYVMLIKKYREMTDAVEKGAMTRSARKEKALAILDTIKEKEMSTVHRSPKMTESTASSQQDLGKVHDNFVNEMLRDMMAPRIPIKLH